MTQGQVISVWVRSVGTPTGRGYFGFGATSAGTYSMQMAPNTGELILGKNVGYGYQNLAVVSQSWLPDRWYRFEIDWKTGGQIIGRLFDSDGVTLLNQLSATDTTYTAGGIAFRSFDSTKHFDTVQKGTATQTPNPDLYAFALKAGEAATLTVTKLNNLNVTVQLVDSDGTPLSTGISGTTNVDGAVVFVATTPGTYYAKVTGEILAQYRLMVARGAAFDLEDINDAPATAQDITAGKVAFGYVGGINVLWVGYESSVALSSSAVVTRITPAQLATQNLAGFGAIVIDDSNTLSVLQSRASDISAFVNAGGGLVTDQGGAFDFSWVPNAASLTWTPLHGDDVSLTTAGITHPVTLGTTNAGLANWGNSYHGVFTATAGMDVLTVNSTSQAHTLAGLYGSGRLVYFGLHPTLHQPIGDSLKLIRQSVAWANGTNPVDVDYYKITLAAGATRTVYTLTPGGGPGEFVNNLNPGFQIVGPTGSGINITKTGTGNQTETFTALVAGTYVIRVFAEDNTFGEYILIDPPPAETEIVATGDRTPTGPIDRGQGASSMTTGSAAPVIAVTGRHTQAVNSLLTIPSHEDARHHTARTQAADQAITSLLGRATRRRFGASLRPDLVNELFAKPTAVLRSASPTSLRLDLVDELFADSELLADIADSFK